MVHYRSAVFAEKQAKSAYFWLKMTEKGVKIAKFHPIFAEFEWFFASFLHFLLKIRRFFD